MKVTLTDEELAVSAASFTLENPVLAADPLVTISLHPHEHSLFCERKERVCTSSGKLQEHETLLATFLGDSKRRVHMPGLRWHRSSVYGLSGEADAVPLAAMEYSVIPGVDGCASYELTVDDVGCFLKLTGSMKPEAEAAVDEGAGAEAGAGAGAEHSAQECVAFESAHVLGPVAPGPPRLVAIKIVGEPQVGQRLVAQVDYVGGTQGASEFWWMRIRDGERENMSEPSALSEVQVACLNPSNPTNPTSADADGDGSDPRVYLLGSADRGCVFKLKCRPVRADGYRGEVFTSKPSPKVE